jgi:hypothetical protein
MAGSGRLAHHGADVEQRRAPGVVAHVGQRKGGQDGDEDDDLADRGGVQLEDLGDDRQGEQQGVVEGAPVEEAGLVLLVQQAVRVLDGGGGGAVQRLGAQQAPEEPGGQRQGEDNQHGDAQAQGQLQVVALEADLQGGRLGGGGGAAAVGGGARKQAAAAWRSGLGNLEGMRADATVAQVPAVPTCPKAAPLPSPPLPCPALPCPSRRCCRPCQPPPSGPLPPPAAPCRGAAAAAGPQPGLGTPGWCPASRTCRRRWRWQSRRGRWG